MPNKFTKKVVFAETFTQKRSTTLITVREVRRRDLSALCLFSFILIQVGHRKFALFKSSNAVFEEMLSVKLEKKNSC